LEVEIITREKDLLTAIVPVTKMAGRLTSFESWLRESSEFPLRVVIVHDEQDELTRPEIDAIVAKSENHKIQVIHKYFGSPGLARNLGIDLAKTDWVAFWDSDDFPLLSNIFSALNEIPDGSEVIIGNFEIFLESSGGIIQHSAERSLKQIPEMPGIWRFIFKLDDLDKVRFEEFRWGEDQLFLEYLDLQAKSCVFKNVNFYRYSIGGEHHLVNQGKWIYDLQKVFLITSELLVREKASTKSLLIGFYVNQLFTLLSRGNNGIVLLASRNFTKTFLAINWKSKIRLMYFGAYFAIRKINRVHKPKS